jgi:hypothetical protein
LDKSHHCAPELKSEWLPALAPKMCFRVVVRALEAWLLADAERFADFFHVARGRIPNDTESLPQPKLTVVTLVGYSRRKEIRQDMVPRPGSGRVVGPAYASHILEFARDPEHGWRPSVASQHADSLNRCLRCMRALVNGVEHCVG